MQLNFTKMHGLGNDFVVFDAINQQVRLSTTQIRRLADRRFGVGCDQVLLVEAAAESDVDFVYRIYNADGSEVEQCGNGARCFARFVRDKGLCEKNSIRVRSLAGINLLRLEADDQVTVDMGVPDFTPAALPIDVAEQKMSYQLSVADSEVEFSAVSMGNPHIVLQVEDIESAPVVRLGTQLESHSLFPNRVNVGFAQQLAPDHIRLRVFERGAGETLACGTGACAAVAVGRQQGRLNDKVAVDLPGGTLQIAWAGGSAPLYMTGPAETVFEGHIDL